MNNSLYVIAAGNPFDGVTLYGDPEADGMPWSDADAANEYANDEFRNVDWWVVEVHNPAAEASDEEEDI